MAVTGCQGNGKKIRMFYKAAILSIKHYVHINDSRTIETRHSQLSNDVGPIKRQNRFTDNRGYNDRIRVISCESLLL